MKNFEELLRENGKFNCNLEFELHINLYCNKIEIFNNIKYLFSKIADCNVDELSFDTAISCYKDLILSVYYGSDDISYIVIKTLLEFQSDKIKHITDLTINNDYNYPDYKEYDYLYTGSKI